MEMQLKSIIFFIIQTLTVFCVIIISLYNLSTDTVHRETWIAILSSTLAHILKVPDFIRINNENNENNVNKIKKIESQDV